MNPFKRIKAYFAAENTYRLEFDRSKLTTATIAAKPMLNPGDIVPITLNDAALNGARLKFYNGDGKEVDIEGYLAEQSKIDRFRTHYTDMATRQGWDKDAGEGAVEFLMRKAYSTGHEDAINREGRVLINAPLLSEAATAIQVLAEGQPDTEVGDYWSEHYGSLADQFRRMLDKASRYNCLLYTSPSPRD